MSHGEIAVCASPKLHEKLIKRVNKMKYPFEGKVRKGYNRPYINEWRLYDVRIKKELLPQFLKDFNTINPSEYQLIKGGNIEGHVKMRVFKLLIKIARKFIGLHDVKYKQLPRKNVITGKRYYAVFLGSLKDKVKNGQEEL